MATGFDLLHLAEVFGISEHNATRYAINARQLTGPSHREAAPDSPATRTRPGKSTVRHPQVPR